YPGYISYGYNSCAICHYNPQGNGILTDYGRGIAASKVSANLLYDNDEEAVKHSNFLMSKPLPKWFRMDFDVRTLFLKSDLESDSSNFNFIPMKFDSSVVFQNSSRNLYAVLNAGYYRRKRVDGNFISREHYVAWLLNEKLHFSLGF